MTDSGIPAAAEAGEPVAIWVNVSSEIPIYEVLLSYSNPTTGQLSYEFMNLSAGNSTCGTWSYVIPAQSWKGILECRVTVKDESGSTCQLPESGYEVIEITGEEKPKDFPWNIVIIIVFLGVVLVLTELIFKPGLYRPTGRERAKALEEEDKLSEEKESGKED